MYPSLCSIVNATAHITLHNKAPEAGRILQEWDERWKIRGLEAVHVHFLHVEFDVDVGDCVLPYEDRRCLLIPRWFPIDEAEMFHLAASLVESALEAEMKGGLTGFYRNIRLNNDVLTMCLCVTRDALRA